MPTKKTYSATRNARSLISAANIAIRAARKYGVPLAKRGLALATSYMSKKTKKASPPSGGKKSASTQTGNTIQKVYNKGGGVPSTDTFRRVFKADRKALSCKKVGASNYYEVNYPTSLTCTEGFQQAISAMSYGINNHLQTIMSHVPTASTVGTNTTQRYVLCGMNGETVIQNSSLATAFVDIYDIALMRDINILPENAWADGMVDSTPSGTPSTANFLKAQPQDCQRFKDYFKILKRSQVVLTQGSIHRHFVNLKYNRFIDNELISTIVNNQNCAIYTMVNVYGQPATDPVSSGTTTAQIKLDMVSTARYRYTFVQDNSNSIYQTDNLLSLLHEVVVSVGAGTIVPNAIA